MITINRDSEAGEHLVRVLLDPETYKVSLDFRANNTVAIKRNEGMWTAGLPTEFGGSNDA